VQGNLLTKIRFLETSTSRADRLLIAGIVAGIVMFWLLVMALVMRLAAAVG
jgi:hypothetical protein